MSTLEIIFLILFLIVLISIGIISFFLYQRKDSNPKTESETPLLNEKMLEKLQSLRDEIIEIKTKTSTSNDGIGTLRENFQKLNSIQFQNKEELFSLSKKFIDLTSEAKKNQLQTQTLSESINEVRDIFSSNYRRGNLGETTLYFIVESIFGIDNEIVCRQYTMKNGKQPDLFLRSEETGIPIDSKFPLDNFSKIISLDKKDFVYKQEVQVLKKHIRNHVHDISEKYISVADNAEQAIMYLPSQALFEFIHTEKEFDIVRTEAMKKKVLITSPNTLPAILRLVLIYHRDSRQRKKAHEMLKDLRDMNVEFNRFSER
ncbi:MAG: DNA recombination protein RmuC [Mollicutes bacterium]|nr:MAG: DNA recombination protein RmuC [Mollicutes bacterium]